MLTESRGELGDLRSIFRLHAPRHRTAELSGASIPVYLRLFVLCFGFYRTSCAFGEQLGSGEYRRTVEIVSDILTKMSELLRPNSTE